MSKRLLLAALASVGTLALGGAAQAITFTNIGDTFTTTFNGIGGSPVQVIPGLSADVTYTLTDNTGTDWEWTYSIDNNSTIPARVSGIGFDVNPDATAASVDGVFNVVGSGQVPVGFGSVELCFKDGGGTNNCAGGGGGGVNMGDTDGGTFQLTFGVDPDSVDFTNLVIRWQSIDSPTGITSGIGVPCVGEGCNEVPGGFIPEPATWAMMILGFGGVGAMLRRRRGLLLAA